MANSTIVRVDYYSQSMILNLADISFLRLDIFYNKVKKVDSKQLKIVLHDVVGSTEYFFEDVSDKNGEELTKIYLDLFTKWKNFNIVELETEEGYLNSLA